MQTGGAWARERVKRAIVARYNTRLHMSLILATTCMAGMLASWLFLRLGVGDMRLRYPLVIVIAYATFLCGVWFWLRFQGFVHASPRASRSRSDGLELPDISPGRGGSASGGGGIGRGGGSFDGGGASASWAAQGRAPMVATSVEPSGDKSVLGEAAEALGDVGDAEGLAVIVLAVLLAIAVFAASGYLVWMAPDILAEAAFGALLAGGLARPVRGESTAGWMGRVVGKTWWPFAIVLVIAFAFAAYASEKYPGVTTFGAAVRQALQ